MRKETALFFAGVSATVAVLGFGAIIKTTVKEIAEVKEVSKGVDYVLVRLARGEYNNLKGLSTMVYDYKFYQIISNQAND